MVMKGVLKLISSRLTSDESLRMFLLTSKFRCGLYLGLPRCPQTLMSTNNDQNLALGKRWA